MRLPAFLYHPLPWFIAILTWFATLLFLSSQSNLEAPMPEFMHRDKVMHAVYFALGGVCLFIGLRLWRPAMPLHRICIAVVVFCALIGAMDEYRQSFTPNRSGNDVFDWLADTLGGVIACFAGQWLLAFLNKRA